jgi:LCP family protein required for cell wall assembly
LGVLVISALAWALTLGAETSKRVTARSIRGAVGPPEPGSEVQDGALAEDSHGAQAQVVADAGLEPTLGPPEPPPQKPRGLRNVSFVLLLGLDNRNDRVTGRTDTMVIAAFRHRDGKVAAFSVPRDLWIEIPNYGPGRISSVVRVGEARFAKGRGVPMLREVIQNEFGIRIDRYAAVDLAGFVDLVDQVDGVQVDVQCPIVDCLWLSRDDEACEELSLEAGPQVLDGRTALKFVRSRHGRGDRDRRRRQQAVLLAFAKKVRDGGLTGLPELWDTAQPFVETDLDWKAAAYYGSFALETELSELSGFSVSKGLVRRHVTEENKHVLLLQRDDFDQALAEVFQGQLPGLKKRKKCPDPNAAEAARAGRR